MTISPRGILIQIWQHCQYFWLLIIQWEEHTFKITYNRGNPRNLVTHVIHTILWYFIIAYLKRAFQDLCSVLVASLQNLSNCFTTFILSSAWKLCYFILAFPYRCLATVSNSKEIELLWYLLNFPFVIKRNYSKTF